MMTKDDIAPGSMVRFNAEIRRTSHAHIPTALGILIAFDYFGDVNPTKGDPLVLWIGEKKPRRMAALSLEIVS